MCRMRACLLYNQNQWLLCALVSAMSNLRCKLITILILLLFLSGCKQNEAQLINSPTVTSKVIETSTLTSPTQLTQTSKVWTSTKTIAPTVVSSATRTPELVTAQPPFNFEKLPNGDYLVISSMEGKQGSENEILYFLDDQRNVVGELILAGTYHEVSISPTNNAIAYSYGNDQKSSVSVRNLISGKTIQIGLGCHNPFWSSKGGKLGYVCEDGIHIGSYNEGEYKEDGIIEKPEDEISGYPDEVVSYINIWNASWSPNGNYIMFFLDYRLIMPEVPPAGPFLIDTACISMNVTCKNDITRIDLEGVDVNSEYSWSPDSKMIAITLYFREDQADIYLVDISKGDIVNALGLSKDFSIYSSLAWSLDGEKIVFKSEYHDIQMVPNKGGTPEPYCGKCSWTSENVVSWIKIDRPDGNN